MTNRTTLGGALALAGLMALGGTAIVSAQTAPASPSAAPVPATTLSLGDIESRMNAQGITIKEIELEGLLAEVEGHDAQGRKVELTLDRRSGEVLSRKAKNKTK
ncbi:MAG: PepSY domain-containing protein [Steroidobacteraceae bacterium]